MPTVTGRPADPGDRAALDRIFEAVWGGPYVAARDTLFDLTTYPSLVAVDGGTVVGALQYDIDGEAIEVVAIAAEPRTRGAGTVLLDAAAELGTARGLTRLWLITTNDNLDAMRFYQRRGLRIESVDHGAVVRARVLKPSIPLVGSYGIEMRDEIVFSRSLAPAKH